MLLSIVLGEQNVWGWSALRAGLAIAPGPLMVPLFGLAVAGRLIKRYGPAPVMIAGCAVFGAGICCWAALATVHPDYWPGVVVGTLPTGAGWSRCSGALTVLLRAALMAGTMLDVSVTASATPTTATAPKSRRLSALGGQAYIARRSQDAVREFRRADIESFARELEPRPTCATVTRRLCTIRWALQ